jgi:predicted aspartyl protease
VIIDAPARRQEMKPMQDPVLPTDRRAVIQGLAASALTTCALIPSAAFAQEPFPKAPVPPTPDQTELQLTRNLFTRVAARVDINDQGPFNFVIDTGAAASAVSDRLAALLALPPQNPVMIHGIAEATLTPSVEVEKLRLLGVSMRQLRCPVLPENQLGADGLVGLDVLSRFKLSFDTQRRAASLVRPGVQIVTSGRMSTGSRLFHEGIRSMRGRFGQLIMTELRVCGEPAAAFVDSGAQYSIGNHALRHAITLNRSGGLSRTRPMPVFGVTGRSLQADLAQVSDLRLGPHRLGPTTLLFADLHCFETLELADRPTLLIGADLLGRFRRVTLDFARNTVMFDGVLPPSMHPLEDVVVAA